MMLLLSTALACPSFEAAVDAALAALTLGDLAATDAALAEAQGSLGCQPVENKSLGRYWLVEGARHQVGGEAVRAVVAFAAARRVAPGLWEPSLGPAFREVYDASAQAGGTGSIDVDANHEHARVDGATPGGWPAPVDAGVHLLQLTRDDITHYGRLVTVADNEAVFVATGLGPLPEAPRPKKKWWLAAGAGALAAGGGALAFAATQQDLETAEDVPEIDAAWHRQQGFTYGAYGLWGAAALGASAFFVF